MSETTGKTEVRERLIEVVSRMLWDFEDIEELYGELAARIVDLCMTAKEASDE